jgi:hypothetical protein
MSTIKSLTTALVIAGALTAPAASAGPATDPIHVVAQPALVQQQPAVSDSGFNWGDAGIGAGAAVALALLSLGGAAGVRRTMSPAS